jgi:hypothetical protein
MLEGDSPIVHFKSASPHLLAVNLPPASRFLHLAGHLHIIGSRQDESRDCGKIEGFFRRRVNFARRSRLYL